jgi:hypothetical protein
VIAVVVVAVVMAVVLGVVVLRFTVLLRQLLDSVRLDRREYAQRLEEAHSQAFGSAMSALEGVSERVAASQAALFERTVDMVAGPQQPQSSEPLAVDAPSLDARPAWMPDDEFDYLGLGLDPTDETMPEPRLEPEGNAHRAVMTRPGEGLLPG